LALFEELHSKNFCVATVHDKDAVRLNKLFIPQENVVLVAVADCAIHSSLGSFYDFYDLIHRHCIVVFISTVECAVSRRQRHLLAEINNLNTYNLALLVNHLEIVFVYLQHQTRVLASIIEHEVACFVAVPCRTCASKCVLPAKLVSVRLKLEMVRKNADL